jgi:hypothetical protein
MSNHTIGTTEDLQALFGPVGELTQAMILADGSSR